MSSASDPTSLASASIADAWRGWIESGRGVPAGLKAFLLASTVRESAPGEVEVTLPPGPASERLSHAAIRAQVEAAFSRYLGRSVGIHPTDAGGGPESVRRISREEVRSDTLRALFRQEPRLERAVQELDLELLD